tara:strand:- start:71 stop:634 length:564 start_codon:yes stop_codon:yes gene_type:complete
MPITIDGSGSVAGISVGGLPDGIVQLADLGATSGKNGPILQEIHASFSTETSIASTTFTNTGLTASITPSSSSNKILIIVSQNLQFARSNTSASGGMKVIKLVSGGSDQDIYEASHSPAALGIQLNAFGQGLFSRMNACVNLEDSPNTTSSVAYRVQAAAGTTSDNGKVVAQEEDTPSHITLMEIAA